MISIFIIYFLIGLLASAIGSVAGLGGGVIIKPVLDLFGHYNLQTIGILSAATVLSMSVMSLIKFRRSGVKTDLIISSILAAGSIAGGFVGKYVFNILAISMNIPTVISFVQSTLLAVLLTLVFLYFLLKGRLKSFQFKNRTAILAIGFVLGFLSAFIGIGGGPLNITVFILLFSMNAKSAAINSIFVIFFSQVSALLLITFTGGYSEYDLSMLGYIIAGGVLGGYLGSNLVVKISNLQVEKIFKFSILIIIFINVFNIIKLIA